MEKKISVICVLCMILLLSACGNNTNSMKMITKTKEQNEEKHLSSKKTFTDKKINLEKEKYTAQFEILEVTKDNLIACGIGNSKGLYSISHGKILKDEKGKAIKVKDLKVGMIVNLTWNGGVQESYPAQFGYDKLEITKKTGSKELIFYKQLIKQLFQVDKGLNDGVRESYFDFSKVSSLTKGEKEGLAYICGNYFGTFGILSTREELEKQGILKDQYGLKHGILVTVEEISSKKNKLVCNASKYRSGDGAYYFSNVVAQYKNGKWSYKIGAEMIS